MHRAALKVTNQMGTNDNLRFPAAFFKNLRFHIVTMQCFPGEEENQCFGSVRPSSLSLKRALTSEFKEHSRGVLPSKWWFIGWSASLSQCATDCETAASGFFGRGRTTPPQIQKYPQEHRVYTNFFKKCARTSVRFPVK